MSVVAIKECWHFIGVGMICLNDKGDVTAAGSKSMTRRFSTIGECSSILEEHKGVDSIFYRIVKCICSMDANGSAHTLAELTYKIFPLIV
ncbi:Hypothetical predicted protein [Olea europaea subsp. europaea]|uniref:Uncharacterized protein n=1 Tax=Olea europaea subsp. europaea TaxID=158383 RepID=A0A8S0RJ06_OLEEU|nr:Hypothetical predicted protein [Olea europaea subsp. europaea]